MRKILFLFMLLFGGFAPPAFAQFTTVTATVQDPNGIPYAGAILNAVLVPGASGGYTLSGSPYAGRIGPVTLDSAGKFTVNFGDLTLITPGSPQWQITIDSASATIPGPLGTGPQSFTFTSTGTTISGSSPVSLTTSLNALAPKLTNFVASGTVTAVTGTSPIVSSGGSAPAISCPTCAVGAGAQVIQSGLLAEYRILPTESPCAIVDYSGNGNNATGCVGTSPTINAITGGLNGNNAGAVSLPSALNAAQTVQIFVGNTAGNTNGALLAGNGAVANSSIFSLTVFNSPSATQATPDQAFVAGSRLFAGWMQNGNNIAFYPRAMIEGNIDVAWDQVCDSSHSNFDTIYVNGVDQGLTTNNATNMYLAQRCSQSHQTAGNYQLLGIASGSCPNYTGCGYMSKGNIYYALFYNRPLNAAEIATNSTFLKSIMAARGVTPTIFQQTAGSFTPNAILAVDGDSLSCGPCASSTPNPVAPYSTYLKLVNSSGGIWNISNMARVGYALNINLQPFGPQAVDPIFQPNSPSNAVVIWGGTNDGIVGASTVSELSSYCQARRAIGWKCIVVTMISRTGLDSAKNTYNAAIRQLWPTFADGLADIAADPNIGADGASASAVYFANDHVHVQDVGIINDETPWIQRAINRMYGNHDFSSATVYSSAAAAAVATTAGSESTNTVTITTAATPANCLAGDMVTVSGTTPAGYSGNWLIRTSTGTQITYFAATASMGAITIQGTIACPQQQDIDQYEVLNFGAGNHTLQSCIGLTGQNIYIQNINASASTLVPFASETITGGGATPTTLAANTTAILQSQLVSASAAGCNWKRIQ